MVDSAEAQLTGRVAASFFLGDRTRLLVDGIGDTPIVIETTNRREFREGEAIALRVDPAALLMLKP